MKNLFKISLIILVTAWSCNKDELEPGLGNVDPSELKCTIDSISLPFESYAEGYFGKSCSSQLFYTHKLFFKDSVTGEKFQVMFSKYGFHLDTSSAFRMNIENIFEPGIYVKSNKIDLSEQKGNIIIHYYPQNEYNILEMKPYCIFIKTNESKEILTDYMELAIGRQTNCDIIYAGYIYHKDSNDEVNLTGSFKAKFYNTYSSQCPDIE